MSVEPLVINGVNGASGEYLLPPMTVAQISTAVRGLPQDTAHLRELRFWYEQVLRPRAGVVEGVDPLDLAESGWGVIFAQDAPPAIYEALAPLLAHRREQAGRKHEHFYREYLRNDGYRPGETKLEFLARHGAGPGPADPRQVPYYLLLVGDPEAIPYRFQYQLDVQYAVGRIHFDSPEGYAHYARSVVQAETGERPRPRRAAFFGVQNPDDQATEISAKHLVEPLAGKLARDSSDWTILSVLRDEARKPRLCRLLGGDETPDLLFTASHGMGFPAGDVRQLAHQGALLCGDWPGPRAWRDAIPEEYYLSAEDVGDDAQLLGLVALFFACFGAGTPHLDSYARQAFGQQVALAPHAFVARLPQRLLGHPKGGALAVVGHIDRVWSCSFTWPGVGRQAQTYESALRRLARGCPVGYALEFFDERYAELSTELAIELAELRDGKVPDDLALAGMWTANNDARNYVILGDPAVRLGV